jgi:hypothetical protein
MQLEDSRQPVRIGNVAWLYIEHDLSLIAFLRTATDFDTPLQRLQETLVESGRIEMLQHTRNSSGSQLDWQGQVLLAWEP